MARHQNGRTEICRDFLGAKMAEPSFAENAKCPAEPNRTEIAEICFQAMGGVHPITIVHSTLYPTRAELHIFERVRVAMLPFIMAHK